MVHGSGASFILLHIRYPINSTTKVVVPGSVRSVAATLFKPSEGDDSDDDKHRDLPALILRALQKCTTTTRKGLAHQILLLGGGARLPGLQRALVSELNHRLVSNKTNPHFEFSDLQGLHGHFECMSSDHVCPTSYLGWVGGSIVGTLDQYGQKITKETYSKESKIIPDWMNLKSLSLVS